MFSTPTNDDPLSSLKYTAQFIDARSDGLIVFDTNFVILNWNTAMEEISSIKRVQAIGKRIFDLYPYLQHTTELNHFSETLRGKTISTTGEFSFHKNGIKDYFLLHYSSLQDNTGQVIGGMLLLNKTNDIDYSAHQLQETESRFHIMADCAPVMLWMAGKNSECYFFNQVWLNFTGKTLAEEKGVGWAAGVHPEDLQAMMNIYLHSFNKRESFSMTYRLRRHDGEYRWILDNGTPLFNNDKEFEGFIGSCIDITEQKHTEERLKETAASLLQTNQELEQMTRIASHDLQEPLRAIVGFSQFLLQDYKDKFTKDAENLLHRIIISSHRMQQLILSMLEYSNITAGNEGFAPLNMNELVENILSDLEFELNKKHAQIHFNKLPTLVANSLQISRVLQNIINNAIKYSNTDLVISIKSEETAEEWIFNISDNGIGFDMKYAHQVFEVFKRLWTKDQYPGEGLGLAICKKIIEGHGGRIWITSEINKGTTVAFTLPKKLTP